MATIRPIERGDLPAVAALVAAELPGWRRDVSFLERSLIDHPWAPDPLPSLVAVEDGVVIGSVGAQARRLTFDGEDRTGVSVSHLVVSRAARGGAAGMLLVRHLLAAGQDMTWTDSGTPDVARLWRIFGAEVDHVRAANWMLILRPAAWTAAFARSQLPGGKHRDALPIAAVPLQVAGPRFAAGAFPPIADGVTTRDATPEQLCELPPQLLNNARLRVCHDPAYLAWVFEHIESTGAPVVRRVVLREGAAIGWYAYLRKPGVGRVLFVAAAPRDVDAVFGAMVAEARSSGVVALSGRLEPHLDAPVRRRFAGLGLGQLPILHASDPQLRLATTSSASLISEMELVDSEWW